MASPYLTGEDFARAFYNKVDRLLGMEGRLVRGRSRTSDELFDDDGVLVTGPRTTDNIYTSGRKDESKWKAPGGQGLRVVKETRRYAKDGSTQWF